jgi:hypothetical protein
MIPLKAVSVRVTAPDEVMPAAPTFILFLSLNTNAVEALELTLVSGPLLAMSTAPPALAESAVLAGLGSLFFLLAKRPGPAGMSTPTLLQ